MMATHHPTGSPPATERRTGNCPNCLHGHVSKPDVVCTECQAEPRFKAAVDAFNARQVKRRQAGAA